MRSAKAFLFYILCSRGTQTNIPFIQSIFHRSRSLLRETPGLSFKYSVLPFEGAVLSYILLYKYSN